MADIIVNAGQSIQQALNQARPGDVIRVQAGTYNEKLVLPSSGTANAPITLIGEGDVTINGAGTGVTFWHGVIYGRDKSNWVIDGLNVINGERGANIWLNDSNNITVQNCYTSTADQSGIMALGGTNFKALNNTVVDANRTISQEAISIWSIEGFEVANNTVRDCHKEGIDIKGGSGNGEIYGNHVYEVGGPGIYVDPGGTGDKTSTNIKIYDNHCHDIGGVGMHADTYARRAGIAVECEKPGGVIDGVQVYNNTSGYNCTLGGFWTGNRSGDGRMKRNISVTNNQFHSGTGGGSIYFTAPPNSVSNWTISGNEFSGDAGRLLRYTSQYPTGSWSGVSVGNNTTNTTSGYVPSYAGGGTSPTPFQPPADPPACSCCGVPDGPYTATIVITDPDNRVRTFTVTSSAKFTIT